MIAVSTLFSPRGVTLRIISEGTRLSQPASTTKVILKVVSSHATAVFNEAGVQ